ncbi:MAG TPA: transporter associated domain-containing protein, partial [Ilumatobacteraceae bacterium]|nr:transporter associated domain-containing protein [Ilumatobacteraceae bacterium]
DEVERLDDGVYLVDGGMNITDFNTMMALDLPDDDWETVGGFVFATLEHVPDVGESVEYQGWTFAAEVVEGRRIRLLRVTVNPPDDADAPPGPADAEPETAVPA